MVSISKTIQVEYRKTPEYVEAETIPVELSAFDHCVYLDVPDFDRANRKIENVIDSNSGVERNGIQCADVSTRQEAIEYLRGVRLMEDSLLPRWHGEVNTTQYLLKGDTLDEHPELLSEDPELQDFFVNRDEDGRSERELKQLFMTVGEYFAKRGVVPSNRSGRLMPLGEWACTSGYVATVTKEEAGTCRECGSKLSETKTVVSSSNSTTTPDRYRCDEEKGGCGRRWKGITTG